MPKLPIVKQVEIKRTLLGAIQVKFNCPHCRSELTANREEIGKPDECPQCGNPFMVSDEIERKLREAEQAKEQAKEEAAAEKQAARERRKQLETAQKFIERQKAESDAARRKADEWDDEVEGAYVTQPREAYRNLKLIAMFWKLIAWLNAAGAILYAVWAVIAFVIFWPENDAALFFVMLLGSLFAVLGAALVTFVILMAIAESILLFVNLATDVRDLKAIVTDQVD